MTRNNQKKPLTATAAVSSSEGSVSGGAFSSGLLRLPGTGVAAESNNAKMRITRIIGIHATPQMVGPTGSTHASAANPARINMSKKLQKDPQGPVDLNA